MEEINRTYEDQLWWDPENWTVRSFHDNTGTALVGATTTADSTILKTAGSGMTSTTLGDLRPADVMFPCVRVNFDSSHLNRCGVNLSLDTFIRLP